MTQTWKWFGALVCAFALLGCNNDADDYDTTGGATTTPDTETDIIEEDNDIDGVLIVPEVVPDTDTTPPANTGTSPDATVPNGTSTDTGADTDTGTTDTGSATGNQDSESGNATDEALPVEEEPAVREEPATSLPETSGDNGSNS